MASNSRSVERAHCYRACDARFPFLWTAADQPPGRWHAAGEGPCHYLATSAKGAWAEVLRHEGITDAEDLVDLERAMWEVEGPLPAATPDLGETTLTGGEDSYPACQAVARALRASGQVGLIAPSAAVLSGTAERMALDPEDGVHIVEHIATSVVVLFDGAVLVGMPVAEGQPEPGILQDIRQLPYPGEPYPGKPYPGKPYPGEPYPGKPYPGKPYPGKPYPGKPYPGKPWLDCLR